MCYCWECLNRTPWALAVNLKTYSKYVMCKEIVITEIRVKFTQIITFDKDDFIVDFLLLVLIKLLFLWYEIWTCHRMEMLLIQRRFTHLMKRHLVICVGVQACVCMCMFWDNFILDICIDWPDSRSPSPTLPYCPLHCWCCLRNLELVKIYVLKIDLLTLRTEIIKIHDSGSVCTSWLSA